ncbi:hypothetical protein E7V67_023950 [[Empedobacter] haloabium]|uniref:DUF3445 domain-containing protein n=1 Tax=[Empedobacter] haloabium TaxID=592317 RepID=A0ABZ1UJ36_9BURK
MNHQAHASLYVDELLRELETTARDEVILRHPMTFGETAGRARVDQLAAATGGVFATVEPAHSWSGPDIGGREWHGQIHDRRIRGMTVARRYGQRVEVDIFLATFPAPVRHALREACGSLIAAEHWSLPAGIDTALPPVPADEVLDPKLAFQLTDDAQLTSPVAVKPINGAADVVRICGHSIKVYGGRASGPRLTVGPTTLSLWTGEVAGLPLEVANVIHWQDQQHVKLMAMAMRPWPVVELFQARMKARTLPFLDDSYFEPAAEAAVRERAQA